MMTRPSNELESVVSGPERETDGAPPTPLAGPVTDTQVFAQSSLDGGTVPVVRTDIAFRVRWRGYDRGQVDTYRAQLEDDLASTRASYRRALRTQAQFSEVFRAMEADLSRLRGELANRPSALSQRLRDILHLAAQDADDTRAAAQAEARQKQADAQAEADQIRAEAEEVLKQAQGRAAIILSHAQAEQEKGKAELEQEQATVRQQLADAVAEADQARELADVQAAERRDNADRQAAQRRDRANAAAAARLREMSEQLAELSRQRDDAIASLARLRETLAETLNAPIDTDVPASESS